MDNSVRKEVTKSAITIDKVYVADFQKSGSKTAQLRQQIKTVSFYPSKQIKTNLADNPFSLADFNYKEEAFPNVENRVCWIDVPAAITSVEDVLAKLPVDSCIYKIISNQPILTSNQSFAIEEGLTTMDAFADKQVVRYGNGAKDNAGQLIEGNLVLDLNDKPQYRQVFFSNTPKGDIDNRTSVADDFYSTPEIVAELTGDASVIAGQEIF